MLRSKSRSGPNDLRQKSHSSRFSRTLSATKLCRGDALGCQIDSNALVSLERKKPSKVDNLFEEVTVQAVKTVSYRNTRIQ
ncbi:hypothetical protein K7X08_025634 [Anisodus acutangulus]|uniref:Uncharacterized protein n=1 Tax=Anisodus acutangulus TaxID=402998 RepID=A0A9Q1LWM8_9SOLA|nr:hypothetical protein K7X08_025634 [Anisodus acutangulus]